MFFGTPRYTPPSGLGLEKMETAGVDDLVVYMQTAVKYMSVTKSVDYTNRFCFSFSEVMILTQYFEWYRKQSGSPKVLWKEARWIGSCCYCRPCTADRKMFELSVL